MVKNLIPGKIRTALFSSGGRADRYSIAFLAFLLARTSSEVASPPPLELDPPVLLHPTSKLELTNAIVANTDIFLFKNIVNILPYIQFTNKLIYLKFII